MQTLCPPRGLWAVLAVALLAGALGACAAQPVPWDRTPYPLDYRERHPVVLSEQPETLQVFPRWAYALDARQADDVRSFAQGFRRDTMSALQVAVPTVNGRPTPLVKTTARAVRQVLEGGRIDPRNIKWLAYDATGLGGDAPLTLSFGALTAAVPHACGAWPYDLAAGAGLEGFQNEGYWNLGCATQSTLALQTADPLDLVRPQVQGRSDTVRSVNDIQKLRTGADPSTSYRTQAESPSAIGAGN